MEWMERKNITNLPYSLHDAHINKIIMKGTSVKLYFREGYYIPCSGDCIPVEGYIEIQAVDEDFCYVYVMNTNGYPGKFKGKKYKLKEFIKKHSKIDMEIINETYGYNQSKFSGWMYKGKKKKIREFIIEIYHFGSMKYITKK